MRLVKTKLYLFTRKVIVGRQGLEPISAHLAFDRGRRLFPGAGPRLSLGFAVLSAPAPDLGLHFGDLDRELAVE